jgi:RNA polymerase sigma factor (sigma-70 family)
MEKPDPYGEWVLHQNDDVNGSTPEPVDEVLLAAARSAWPRVLAHARRELEHKESGAETEALAAEVWEAVLKSVSKALHRKGDKGSSIADLQGYLFSAFHHRFNRFLKTEQRRRETIELVPSTVDFDRIESAQDTRWVSELERTITVKQVVSHMDEWTRKVWQARQYGYSWKDISKRLGLTEQKAKMKFRYGLEKTRQNLVKMTKRKHSD